MDRFPYDDIIGLEHHVSGKHTPMSSENRAAQFAPFAALTGHGALLAETAGTTSSRYELSAEEQHILSRRLAYVMSLQKCPVLTVCHFQPDTRKEGGEYVTSKGILKKVEKEFDRLIFTDGEIIPLSCIVRIESDVFDDSEDFDDFE